MKRLLFCLLAFTFLVAAQVDFDKVIPTYLDNTEDYSVFEIAEQTGTGAQLNYVLVLVNDTPSFALDGDGKLIENRDKINSISSDYLQNGENPPSLTAAELANLILEKTQDRKVKYEVNTAVQDSTGKLENVKKTVENAKALLPGVDFSQADAKVNTLTAIARQMRGNATLELIIILRGDFNEEHREFEVFTSSLNKSSVNLSIALQRTREARELLNEKKVSVGRDSPAVIESEEKLNEAEALVQTETINIVQLNEISTENANAAVGKSEEALEVIRSINGNSFDFASLALAILAAAIVIAGVAFYFKKLKKPEEKVEN